MAEKTGNGHVGPKSGANAEALGAKSQGQNGRALSMAAGTGQESHGEGQGHHGEGHGHDEHHGDGRTSLDFSDILIGAVVFYFLSELVFVFIGKFVPGLLSREILFEMQLSGGLFILLWAILGKSVFEPFFQAAIEREERTEGDERRAGEMRRKVAEREVELQEKLRIARLKGIQRRDALLEQARGEAQEILDAVTRASEEELGRATAEINQLQAAARAQVGAEAQNLSQVVLARVLGGTKGQMQSNTIH